MSEHEPRQPGPIGHEPKWNESMYVFWRDPGTGISGWTRIAQQPNQAATSTFVCVARPSGHRYRHFELGAYAEGHRGSERWRGEGLEFWWEDDVLHVRYESSDCAFDLEWRGFYEPVDFHALMATFVEDLGEINAQHVEQSGSVTGTVRVGEVEATVDAMGHRDHSWGHRDTGRMLTSRWMIGCTGPELAWSGVAVLLDSGRLITTGFVVRDGEVIPVRDLGVTLATREDGLSYTTAVAHFELIDDTSLDVTLEDVMVGGVLEVPPWVGIETTGVARVGGRLGIGNCETANNITGGSTTPPMLVTGGAVGQGLSGPSA